MTAGATAPAPPAGPTVATRRGRRLPDETGVLIALLTLVVVVGLLRPNFLQPATLFQQLSGAAFIGMLALGMVFVVAIRDIDLSVGWMFNFSAVIAAKAMVFGIDPWLAAGIGVAFGALLGVCGEYLDIKKGKFGAFFLCSQCGPVSIRKSMGMDEEGFKLNKKFRKEKSTNPESPDNKPSPPAPEKVYTLDELRKMW